MLVKFTRLGFLLAVFTFLLLISQRHVIAATYCCDTCASLENDFNSQCPGGAGDSEDCANMAWSVNHCWNFCNFSLCEGYSHYPVCDWYCFGSYCYPVCWSD
jgi:hypothetical protein